MPDLAVLVPSRGRPHNVTRLIRAFGKTCRAATVLHFGFDEDDSAANVEAIPLSVIFSPVRFDIQPRMGLGAWTNRLAAQYAKTGTAPYLASLGDDMVPVTDGWDERLITAVEHMGGGFAYPNDGRRSDVPEACVISTPVVRALGWMCEPSLKHWYIDNVWRDIGAGAGCLMYCGDVLVRHLHPNVTGQPGDQTYNDAAQSFDSDLAAYQRWRFRGLAHCVEAVRAVRGTPVHPV